jgi:hypothetical protein
VMTGWRRPRPSHPVERPNSPLVVKRPEPDMDAV